MLEKCVLLIIQEKERTDKLVKYKLTKQFLSESGRCTVASKAFCLKIHSYLDYAHLSCISGKRFLTEKPPTNLKNDNKFICAPSATEYPNHDVPLSLDILIIQ